MRIGDLMGETAMESDDAKADRLGWMVPRHHWALLQIIKEMGALAHKNYVEGPTPFKITVVADEYEICTAKDGSEYVVEPSTKQWTKASEGVEMMPGTEEYDRKMDLWVRKRGASTQAEDRPPKLRRQNNVHSEEYM